MSKEKEILNRAVTTGDATEAKEWLNFQVFGSSDKVGLMMWIYQNCDDGIENSKLAITTN